jgi:hypothetical protein
MAKSAPLSIVPQMDEERPAINVQTEEALQKLLSALEARQNRTFDPRLLAMGRAFLTPSPSGSSFEGIGRAAEAYAAASEAMRQEDIDVARQRLEILGQMGQMQRSGMRDEAVRSIIESVGAPPMAGAKPPAAPIPGEAVPGSEAYAPAGFTGPGIQIMPGNPGLLADRRLALDARQRLKLAQTDPSINIVDLIEKINEADRKAIEAQRKRYVENENGIVDLALGLLYPFPKGTQPVDRQIDGKTYSIPPSIAALLDFHQMNGNVDAYNALLKTLKITKEEQPKGATGSSVISKEDLEIAAAARKAQAEAEAKAAGELEAERRKQIIEAGDKAGASRRLASQFMAFASRPDANQIFGFAARPELSNQIVRLLTTGVGFTGASIGIPDLMESVRTMQLTPEQMSVFQTFAQLTTELSLRMSEAVKGSVSNYEQGLFQKAVVNVEDLPQTIKMKSAMLDARAAFDQEVAKKFEESGMRVQQFRNSSEYKNAVKRYEDKLTLIVEGKPREKVQGLSADQIRAERARRSGQ